MGADNSSGLSAGIRQGCVVVDHSFKILATVGSKKLMRITASPQKPTLLQIKEVGGNVALAGSPTYQLGTASGGGQLVASRAFPAINTGVAAVPSVAGTSIFTADFDVWVVQAAGSAGHVYLIITATEINITDVNANAIP